MVGRTDGETDRRIDGRKEGWTNQLMVGQRDKRTDGQTDGRTD